MDPTQELPAALTGPQTLHDAADELEQRGLLDDTIVL